MGRVDQDLSRLIKTRRIKHTLRTHKNQRDYLESAFTEFIHSCRRFRHQLDHREWTGNGPSDESRKTSNRVLIPPHTKKVVAGYRLDPLRGLHWPMP